MKAEIEAIIEESPFKQGHTPKAEIDSSDDEEDGSAGVERPVESRYFSKKKNVFILSWSGRPVFTRYGDELQLAGFMGVISAIIANVIHQRTPDMIRSIISGNHKFVFAEKGKLYFVVVTRRLEESVNQILEQIEYLHLQILSVLTAKIGPILEKKPSYDVRSLIYDTDAVIQSMINGFERDPCYLFDSVHSLRLPHARRSRIGGILKSSSVAPNSPGKQSAKNPVLFSILLAGKKLVTLIRPRHQALHPTDLLILINLVTSWSSFRIGETWTPICLPKFNPSGFLYAHVSFLEEEICLIQLSAQQDSFSLLHANKERIVAALSSEGFLASISEALNRSQFTVKDVGTLITEFRHFLYKSDKLSQFVEARHVVPYKNPKEKKALFRGYQRLHARVHQSKPRHQVYFEVGETESIFSMVSSGEFEFYAVFSPFVTKEKVIAATNRCLRWIHREESSLFITTSPTW